MNDHHEPTMPLQGKKRELLKDIQNMIMDLQYIVPDAAKLEVSDNDKASRRLKNKLVEFKNGPFLAFTKKVYTIREEIKAKPKKVYSNKKQFLNNNQ